MAKEMMEAMMTWQCPRNQNPHHHQVILWLVFVQCAVSVVVVVVVVDPTIHHKEKQVSRQRLAKKRKGSERISGVTKLYQTKTTKREMCISKREHRQERSKSQAAARR